MVSITCLLCVSVVSGVLRVSVVLGNQHGSFLPGVLCAGASSNLSPACQCCIML